VERSKRNCGRISVFKGREAKLNFAIFHILALKGPLTIYDIHKEVKAQRGLKYTKYANINRRVRDLEPRYLEKVGIRKTRAGFTAALYQIATRGYLAIMLDYLDEDDFVRKADEETIATTLAALISTM
jgi:hypothetical protein